MASYSDIFANVVSHFTPFAFAMSPHCIIFLDLLLALVGLFVVFLLFFKRSSLSLPPGPTGLPLVGNIFDMPSSKEWLTFAQWGEKYGICPFLVDFLNQLLMNFHRRYLFSYCIGTTPRRH
jgi:hypothetical protein